LDAAATSHTPRYTHFRVPLLIDRGTLGKSMV
jgi:hypothetical protein